MDQTPLFHEDLTAALGYLVSALGGNKQVGAAMWPSMPPDKAGRKVADCINDNHQQKFSPDDVMWLLSEGRKAGVHSALAFINSEAGYAAPDPIEPEDERAKLQRQYIEATHLMAGIAKQMEKMNAVDLPMKAVS